MRARPCSGRSATRSISAPSAPHTTTTIAIVAGNGVCRNVIAAQPT